MNNASAFLRSVTLCRARYTAWMPAFTKHIFICTNRRDPDNPKGSCAAKGSEEVLQRFKTGLLERGIKGKMRANAAGCLDACAFGPSVVVYPEGTWYARVQPEDVATILDEHLVGGRPVERLLQSNALKKPEGSGG